MNRIFILSLFVFFSYCSDISHFLQNWAERHRKERRIEIQKEDLEKWKKDLQVSEEKARTLYELIHKFAEENKLQGEIAWKIGKALMEQSSFELSKEFFKQSVQKELRQVQDISLFEEAITYFQKALSRYPISADLLYDAGLCYGNASRALGWEKERFQTAVFLLERGLQLKPKDMRFYYVLGILYGKTTNEFRDVEKAIEYLNQVNQADPYNIQAYFAKANILAEDGQFQEAFFVYEKIIKTLEEMHKNQILRGNIQNNLQYQQALYNLNELQVCIERKAECKIKQQE